MRVGALGDLPLLPIVYKQPSFVNERSNYSIFIKSSPGNKAIPERISSERGIKITADKNKPESTSDKRY